MTERREKGEPRKDGFQEFEDEEKWACDSSVDYRGKIPLRASTGVWRASIFIIAIEFSERLSYFGVAASLIIYLTKVIHQDLETAAKNVNYWSGVTTLMPLLGGFLADAYLGRFSTVLISSIIYLLGLTLLTMSSLIPSLRPCGNNTCLHSSKIHEVVFFISIYFISIGTGGHKPSLESFGADQFDDDHDEERRKKMSFFNWWSFGLCCGLLLGVTLIVYVQDNLGWAAADIILTVVMALSLVIFIVGKPYYRYKKPSGSPFKPMLHVLVAAFAKRNLPYPKSASELYEVREQQHKRGRLLCHTKKLKFLDKAAILEGKEVPPENQSSWRLATVTKVEETKLIVNMIPIWLACLPFGICTSQTTTFFVKQATFMNREIGNNFVIPPASIFSMSAVGVILTVIIYDRILNPIAIRVTRNERGIKTLQRIGIGMIFAIASMLISALIEKKRLNLVETNPQKNSLSMSVFWLAPQYMIIGVADGFTLVGLQEYFYDQVPDSMRSLGIAFYLSVLGAANFLTSSLITVISRLTAKTGRGWFGKDLDSSQLDKFYWLLTGIALANLFVYVFLARRYSYKSVQRKGTNVAVVDSYDHDRLESTSMV